MAPADKRIGQVLQGRYRIVEPIARGAIGVVYLGERLQLGRRVAIKFLHPPYVDQEQLVRRFEVEARAMSRLNHPHCVSIIDYGVEDGPYLVMDFVQGPTLLELVAAGPLAPRRALDICCQVLAALAHAHGQDIIHRDVKAGNVILDKAVGSGDHARLLDFGLAKLVDTTMTLMTAAVALGTPGYMSPEAGRGEVVDRRSDIYSAGVLLFELLCGFKPFVADEVFDVIRMHIEAPVPRLCDVMPAAELSAELEHVVCTAMAKHVERRYQSAEQFAAALRATPEGQTLHLPPNSTAPATRGAGRSGRRRSGAVTGPRSSSAERPASARRREPPDGQWSPEPASGELAELFGKADAAARPGASRRPIDLDSSQPILLTTPKADAVVAASVPAERLRSAPTRSESPPKAASAPGGPRRETRRSERHPSISDTAAAGVGRRLSLDRTLPSPYVASEDQPTARYEAPRFSARERSEAARPLSAQRPHPDTEMAFGDTCRLDVSAVEQEVQRRRWRTATRGGSYTLKAPRIDGATIVDEREVAQGAADHDSDFADEPTGRYVASGLPHPSDEPETPEIPFGLRTVQLEPEQIVEVIQVRSAPPPPQSSGGPGEPPSPREAPVDATMELQDDQVVAVQNAREPASPVEWAARPVRDRVEAKLRPGIRPRPRQGSLRQLAARGRPGRDPRGSGGSKR